MSETQPPNTTPDEEALIRHFMHRQREAEEAETRIIQRYGNRAALAKQVWTLGAAVGTALVFSTVFLFQIKSDADRNSKEITLLRADVTRAFDMLNQIRLDLKDKQDVKR